MAFEGPSPHTHGFLRRSATGHCHITSIGEDDESDTNELSVLEELFELEMDIQCTSCDVKLLNEKKEQSSGTKSSGEKENPQE